jgi:hypothetical protein
MKIDGRCHCGNITFEAEVDPATAAICHCIDCQTLSGTAFRTIVKSLQVTIRHTESLRHDRGKWK